MPFTPWSGTGGTGGGDQPYQFRPETYGAAGNGIVCADVGTNGTLTITSPTIAAKGVAGQIIIIHGANGSTSGPYLGAIASITGSGAVLTAGNGTPSGTVANCPAVFGTDDTTAIQAAVTAAGNYAIANQYLCEVLFKDKIYCVAGLTQTGNGSTTPTQNAQIAIPWPNPNGTTQKLIFKLTGAGDAGFLQYFESTVPNVCGTSIVSMLAAPKPANVTFGNQSVIGGPSAAAGFTGSFANVKVVAQGINVWNGVYSNVYAFDLGRVSAARTLQCGANTFAPTGNNGGVAPYLTNIAGLSSASVIGAGWQYPIAGNNLDIWADDCKVEGYETGFRIWDHFTAGRLNSIYCDLVLRWDATAGPSTQHGLIIQHMDAEQYNGGFSTNGGAAQCFIQWDTEASGGLFDLSDGGALWGYFYFGDKVDDRNPVISGTPTNVKIINQNVGTGHMSGSGIHAAPAVPASGSAAALVYRDAGVSIHTGAGVTVSAITVDGTATGLTMAASSSQTIWVPSGKTIALTYAGGAPTWDWWTF